MSSSEYEVENRNLINFYKKVKNSRRIDDSFALETDTELTDEEIKEIDAYWGKYKFAYPEIDYKSFKTFKNRYGKFDVRHCPGAIRTSYFHKHFVTADYQYSWQNKAYLPILFPNVRQTRTVLVKITNIFYDADYNPLDGADAAVALLKRRAKETRLILKSNGLGAGRGIFFIDSLTSTGEIRKILKLIGDRAFIVQEVMEQSSFMDRLDSSCVNTLRVTSFLYNGKVHLLAALIRIGKTVRETTDHFEQTGSMLGVSMDDGKCNSWALTMENERITKLPSGVDLAAEDLYIPNFDEVKKLVERAHYMIPYIKLISWDIALGTDDLPVLIETNFAGMIQMHEAVNGPLFGDLMDELLDKYLLKEFYVPFETQDWVCNEYYNCIILAEYKGKTADAVVPKDIGGKPVTKIRKNAFDKYPAIDSLTVPQKVVFNSPLDAFKNVGKMIFVCDKAEEEDDESADEE